MAVARRGGATVTRGCLGRLLAVATLVLLLTPPLLWPPEVDVATSPGSRHGQHLERSLAHRAAARKDSSSSADVLPDDAGVEVPAETSSNVVRQVSSSAYVVDPEYPDRAPDRRPPPPVRDRAVVATARSERRTEPRTNSPDDNGLPFRGFLDHAASVRREAAEEPLVDLLAPDAPVDDEPIYPVDFGKYDRMYNPTFIPLSAVQLRFRNLAFAVPWCRIGKHRKGLYKLHDPFAAEEQESDVEPPLTAQTSAQWMRGDKLAGIRGKWPSLELRRKQRKGDREQGSDRRRTDAAAPGGPDGMPRQFSGTDVELADGMTCLRRNAMLAVAVGYDDEKLLPLVASWQRYGHPCDELVLLSSRCGGSALWHEGTYPSGRVKCTVMSKGHSKHQAERSRVGTIAGWLQSNWAQYDYVIHVDSRDTQFFGDPFEELYATNITGLFGAAEALRYSDFTTGQSRMWVGSYSSGGGDQHKEIIDWIAGLRLGGRAFPTICSGLYGGSSIAMLDFATAFHKAISGAAGHVQRLHGVDQGILIHLFLVGLSTARFPHPVQLFDEGTNVFTHFIARDQPLLFSPDGRLLNCERRPYAIAHQLDRHGEIDKRHRARLRPHRPFGPAEHRDGVLAETPACSAVGKMSSDASLLVSHATDAHGSAAAIKAQLLNGLPAGAVEWLRNLGQRISTSAAGAVGSSGARLGTRVGRREDGSSAFPRIRCQTVSAVIAVVTARRMATVHAFVGSFLRQHSVCTQLHLIFFVPRLGERPPAARLRLSTRVVEHDFLLGDPDSRVIPARERVSAVADLLSGDRAGEHWQTRTHEGAVSPPEWQRDVAAADRVAILLSIGGGTDLFARAAAAATGVKLGGKSSGKRYESDVDPQTVLQVGEEDLMSEERLLFTANAFTSLGDAPALQGKVLLPSEARGLPAARRAAMSAYLSRELSTCANAIGGGEFPTQVANEFAEAAKALLSATSAKASSSAAFRSAVQLTDGLAMPHVVLGGKIATERYMAAARGLLAKDNSCSAAVVMSFILPVSLHLSNGEALVARVVDASTTVIGHARIGAAELGYTTRGQLMPSCATIKSSGEAPHPLAFGFGFEQPAHWRELAQDYAIGAPPDTMPSGSEKVGAGDLLGGPLHLFSEEKGVPTPALLVPFGHELLVAAGDEFPFVALYTNGSKYFSGDP